MKVDKSEFGKGIAMLLVLVVVFCAALAAATAVGFLSGMNDASIIANADEISNATDFNNMPKDTRTYSTNYTLTEDITVNIGSSGLRRTTYTGTFDGGGHTITFSGGGNNYEAGYNADMYIGLLFGTLGSGGRIQNLNIVFSTDIAIQAYNNRSVNNKSSNVADTSNNAANSSTLFAGIIAGRVINGTFSNVSLTLSSGATFAAIGTDNGSTDNDTRGTGQGAVAGGFAGQVESNVTVTNCSLTNDGIIHSRGQNNDAGFSLDTGWGNSFIHSLCNGAFNKCRAASGGLFGSALSGTVTVTDFTMSGSGAVGAYVAGTKLGSLENSLRQNYAGGLIGEIQSASVRVTGLLFTSDLRVYVGTTSLGTLAGLLVGTGAGSCSIQYLWKSAGDISYTDNTSMISAGNSPGDVTDDARIGVNDSSNGSYNNINLNSFSTSSSAGTTTNSFRSILAGSGTVNISYSDYSIYNEELVYYDTDAGTAETIPGYKYITDISNGKVTIEISLTGNEHLLSYIQYGAGDNEYDLYFDENWYGVNDSGNREKREFTMPYANYDWSVTFAKNIDVTYADFINTGAADGVSKAYDSNGYGFGRTVRTDITSLLDGLYWYSEHFYISNDGNKTTYNGLDGDPEYDTVSETQFTTRLNTNAAAGIYEIRLFDDSTGAEIADGTRLALYPAGRPTKIYNFSAGGSVDHFTYTITKARIVITPNTGATIEKMYDGTTSVPASQIVAGGAYTAVLYGGGTLPGAVEMDVDASRSNYASSEVGSGIDVTLYCRVAETSNFMQVEASTGVPVDTSDYFEVSGLRGTITRRGISITFGETALTYDGTPVAPAVVGGYALLADEATQIRLQDEINELLAKDGAYTVYTFADQTDLDSFINSGYTGTYDPPVYVGSGYYAQVRLSDEASAGNFVLETVNGRTEFSVTPRAVTYTWDEASLNLTYNGGTQQATASFANTVSGDTIRYIVSYDGQSTSGVVNAGQYDVSLSLDYDDDLTENYVLASSHSATMTIAKYTLTLGYFVGETYTDLNTEINGASNVTYDGQIADLRNHREGLHVRISDSDPPNRDEILRLNNNIGSDSLSSLYVILTYSVNNSVIGAGGAVKNAGTYTVTASFGGNYVNAAIGGLNFELSNTTHTFVVEQREVELTAPSNLQLTYNANSQNPGTPSYVGVFDNIQLTSRYYTDADAQNEVSVTMDAGTYYVLWELSASYAVNANYRLTGDKFYSFSIEQLDISSDPAGLMLQILVQNHEYTGNDIELSVDQYIVTALNNVPLTVGRDFEIRYENNVQRGQAAVILKGKENYTGTYRRDNAFTITARSLTATILYDGAPAGGSVSAVYDGSDIFRYFSVELDGVLSADNGRIVGVALLSGSATEAVNVGSYTINANFRGSDGIDPSITANYTMTVVVSCRLNITQAPLSITAEPDDETVGNYSGNMAQGFIVTYDRNYKGLVGHPNGVADKDTGSISIAVNYSSSSGTMSTNPVNAGTYNVLLFPTGDPSVLNNYSYSEITTTLIVSRRDVAISFAGDFVNNRLTVDYSGSAHTVETVAEQAVSDSNTGLIEGDRINLTVYYGTVAAAVNAGSYTLSVNPGSNPNYNLIPPDSQHILEIEPKEIYLYISSDSVYTRDGVHVGKIYDGSTFSRGTNFTARYGDSPYAPYEQDIDSLTLIFTYYSLSGGVSTPLSDAPSNAGEYSVTVSLYQYDANETLVYPAANYIVTPAEGLSASLDFTIARRYIDVAYTHSAQVSYSASSSVRELALGTDSGRFTAEESNSSPNNTGFIQSGSENSLRFITLLISNGVAVEIDDASCVNVGIYTFAGYLDPDWAPNANYEINPARFPDAESAIYHNENMLTTTESLTITPYAGSLVLSSLIDSGLFPEENLSKQYGELDGDRLSYTHTFSLENAFTGAVTEETVAMRFERNIGEEVGPYAFTGGITFSSESQAANYASLVFSSTRSFQITRRLIVYTPDTQRKYYGDVENYEGFSISTTYSVNLPALDNATVNLNITLYRADTNPNAGTYDLANRVTWNDTQNFSVTLAQDQWIGKFIILPKEIAITLDPDGFPDNTFNDTYDLLRNEEPDFYQFVNKPEKSESGEYWGYAPLDNAYASWLESHDPEDETYDEDFSAFIRQYVRITRSDADANNYNVGRYPLTIAIIENGAVSNNFTSVSGENYDYFYQINRFDLNGVGIDVRDLITSERAYDGTTNVSVRTPTEANPGGNYIEYYGSISLRAYAVYDDPAVGERTITVSFSIESSMHVNNFIVPASFYIDGTITPRRLTVSIENATEAISLLYGETPSANIVYSGFATGENENNVGGLDLEIRYSDGSDIDSLKDVGTYYLNIVSASGTEPQNYTLEFVNNSRMVNVGARPVNIAATGAVYSKPVDGTTNVPGFRSDESDPDSIVNEYFTVTNVLENDLDLLKLSYSVSLNTSGAGEAGVLMTIHNLYVADGEGRSNYEFDTSMSYTIRISAVILSLGSVSLPTVNTVYNGSEQPVMWSGTLLDGVSAEIRYTGTRGTVYETSATAPVNAGSYTVECYLILNDFEDIYASSTLQIDRARPTIVFSATDSVQEYGSFVPIRAWAVHTETGLNEELDTVTYSFQDEDGNIPDFVPAGTHSVTASFAGNSNYYPVTSINAQTSLRVTRKVVTMTFDGYRDLVYNGLDRSDDIVVTLSGVVEGDECYPVKRFSPAEVVNAGRYTLEVQLSNPNYITSGAISIGFTIAKKTLTVTAVAGETVYGTTPDFEIVYDGFVEGDTAADLEIAPAVHLGGTTVGANSVAPSGGVDENYDFLYNESILVFVMPSDSGSGSLSEGWTIAIIVIAVVLGIALLIVLAYVVKTMTYRSMYNVDAVKKKVRDEFRKK